MHAVGLDLSLRSTGWATSGACGTFDTADLRGPERLDRILADVKAVLGHLPRVVAEGPSFASKGNAIIEIGKMHGLIEHHLWAEAIPAVYTAPKRRGTPTWGVPPGTLKKFATGSGVASKVEVVVAARERFGYEGTDHDEADAWILRHIGLELIGEPEVEVPKVQREALGRLIWSSDGW